MLQPPPYASRNARRTVPLGTLDLATIGIVCVRASDGWYQTAAENDGTTAFLTKATSNVARWANRTGSLARLLVEGSRTNKRLRSRDLTTTWSAGSGVTTTGNAGNGPDGTAVADRSNVVSNGHTVYQSGSDVGPYTVSQWCRATSGTTFCRLALRSGGNAAQAVPAFQEATLTTTYQRLQAQVISGGTGYYHMPNDCGLSYVGVGGSANAACDMLSDMHQFEVGCFASSFIETAGSNATRAADSCTLASASVPTYLRAGKWTSTIAFECTSAQFISHATEMTIFAFGTGTNDRIALVLDSGSAKLRVIQGGVTKLTTGALVFSRWQDLALTVDSAAGSLTVAGATTGNGTTTGTAWTMQSGDLYLGTTSTGTTPAYVEIDHLMNEAA